MTDRHTPDPIVQAIPIPVVRTDLFEWRRHTWPSEPDWPANPPRIPPLSVVAHLLFGAFVIVFTSTIVVLAAQLATEPAPYPADKMVLTFSLVAASVSAVALLLRRLGVAEGLSRVMFLAFSVATVGALVLTAGLVFLTPTTTMEDFGLIPFLSNWQTYGIAIAGTMLAILVWFLVNAEVRSFDEFRTSFARAQARVMPSGRWERITGEPGGVLRPDASTLERRTTIAEQLTAPLLSELLRMPGVAIVHRIQFPGSATAHIGHAVVAGGRIAIIDSVLWEPADYRLDDWGRVLRNGTLDEGISIALPIAADRFTSALPYVPIESWVVVHRLTDGPLTASSDDNSKVQLVTPDALLREVGNWLSEEGDQVNLYAQEFVLRHRLG